MRYTPGPWHVHTISKTDGEFLIYTGDVGSAPDAHDAAVATVAGGLGWNDTDGRCMESEANARLIAAAPKLLAALRDCLSWLTSYPGGGPLRPDGPYEKARAALAEAEPEATSGG